jgi:hypothetical protein
MPVKAETVGSLGDEDESHRPALADRVGASGDQADEVGLVHDTTASAGPAIGGGEAEADSLPPVESWEGHRISSESVPEAL